jgi:hypothetical protein
MPPWALARIRMSGTTSDWSGFVLGRARSLVQFAERNPREAFMSGIEPLAVETRMLMAGRGSLAELSRMREIQAEACRRAEARETELVAAPGRELLGALGAGFSIASSVVMIATAFG